MSALSNILRATTDGGLVFWCPGCKSTHGIRHGTGTGPRWTYNGNPEKPTFTPSVLVKSGHFVAGHENGPCWCTYYAEHPDEIRDFECGVCHSFVTDGRIQFLSDCTHELAGKTVDLPAWTE